MSVRLHIDRLVIEGWALTEADRHSVGLALERELVRSLGDRTAATLPAAGSIASIRGPVIHTAAGCSAAELGTRIAGSVLQAIGPRDLAYPDGPVTR